MEIRKYIFVLSLLATSCAQMVSPSGGPKDTTPPIVVEEKTIPKNKTTNFNSSNILITFDEYVKLTNPNDQIIISPTLEKKPDFILKGKKLVVKFNSELRPNTTYTINFGNSITDITENNPAAGLSYVFSTGNELDSLSIQGQVVNSYTNQPEKNCWVLLHKNLSDTALQKTIPDYLTKTDNNGYYRLQNLAANNYHIYALRDGNTDYKYSQPSEEIGFYDEVISLSKNLDQINLRLFKEDNEKQYVKRHEFIWPGKLRMIMNKPYEGWSAYFLPYDSMAVKKPTSIYKSNSGDTLDIWVKHPINHSHDEFKIEIRLNRDSLAPIKDTVSFLVNNKNKPTPALKLKSNASGNFSIYDKLRLRFDRPVGPVDETKIQLYKNDTVPVPVEQKTLAYGITLNNTWEEKTDYTLILKENAFQELYYGQHSKEDTIKFTTVKKDYYGNILANISVPEENFVLEILSSRGKIIYKTNVTGSQKINIDHLMPGNYKLRITADNNDNGKWDTGNLSEKIQPEKMYYYKEPITIRSNWDFDLTWKIEN